MTDRFHSLTVVLDRDIREDDAEAIIEAIMMLKHVIAVSGNVADAASWMAEERATSDLRKKLFELLE